MANNHGFTSSGAVSRLRQTTRNTSDTASLASATGRRRRQSLRTSAKYSSKNRRNSALLARDWAIFSRSRPTSSIYVRRIPPPDIKEWNQVPAWDRRGRAKLSPFTFESRFKPGCGRRARDRAAIEPRGSCRGPGGGRGCQESVPAHGSGRQVPAHAPGRQRNDMTRPRWMDGTRSV